MKKAIFYTLFISGFAQAQYNNVDSLKASLSSGTNEEDRIEIYNYISKAYLNVQADSGLVYATKAVELSRRCKRKELYPISLQSLSNAYYFKLDYPKRDSAARECLEAYKALNDKKGIIKIKLQVAGYDKRDGKMESALAKYVEVNALAAKEDDRSTMARVNISLSELYINVGKLEPALEAGRYGYSLMKKLGSDRGVADASSNVGLAFDVSGQPDSALHYYAIAANYFSKLGLLGELANTYCNIGVVYFYLKKYDDAIRNYEAALEINQKIDYPENKANTLMNLGEAYADKKDYRKAEKYYQFGLAMLNKTTSPDYKREGYRMVADFYNKIGKNDLAYNYHLRFSQLSDSIYNVSSSNAVAEMQVKFETDKKIQENKLLQIENELSGKTIEEQRLITYFVIGGLILSLIFGFYIFKSYREKKKTNIALEQSNILIQAQKKEVEHQKELVEEKHKEITDSINYAERIQRSFLATQSVLDENLKDYFVFFRPRDVVSGDFYWASHLTNGNFALVTADSTGHGVPGAIMSLLNITSLERAIETNNDPSAILNETRRIIIDRLKKDGSAEGGKDGMDASLIVFDKQKKKLLVAAANNPVWIVRNKEAIEIKPDKMPVGKHDKQDVSFRQQEIELQKGDVIYTLTDGFPDQFGGEKGKKFMSKNLRELLVSNSHLSMNDQRKLLEATFVQWVGNLEQIDDVTMIGVRI